MLTKDLSETTFLLSNLCYFLFQMAALSAVKNRKSQKLREGFEDFLARCVERSEGRSEVKIDFVLEMLENMDIKIDAKELKKLDKLGDKNRKISRLYNSMMYRL